jgi:hypothetical protein
MQKIDYMRFQKNIFWSGSLLMVCAATAFIYGCTKDDKASLGAKPKASFTVTGGGDSNSVMLISTSTTSIPYWVIPATGQKLKGDTANVRFTFSGTYSVQLLADGAGGVDSVTQQVTINQNDPNACDGTVIGYLTGCGSKVWKLAPIAAAEGVGPAMGNTTWWGNAANEPTGDRVCDWDDTWTFNFNQTETLVYDNNGTFYTNAAEGNIGLGGGSTCDVNSDLPANQAAWASGNFTYAVVPNAGVNSLGQITLNGTGAHIGLPEEANNTVLTSASVSSVTYDIVSMTPNGGGTGHDQLVLGIDVGGGVYWSWTLWSY